MYRAGATNVTTPYEFKWFGDIYGPKPYAFMCLGWAFISQTPADLRPKPAPNRPRKPTREPNAHDAHTRIRHTLFGTALMQKKPSCA